MCSQCARLRESLFTMFAAERTLSGVRSYMYSQITLHLASIVTIFTLEGTLPGVDSFMPSQGALLRESLVTIFALEWTLSGVRLFTPNLARVGHTRYVSFGTILARSRIGAISLQFGAADARHFCWCGICPDLARVEPDSERARRALLLVRGGRGHPYPANYPRTVSTALAMGNPRGVWKVVI